MIVVAAIVTALAAAAGCSSSGKTGSSASGTASGGASTRTATGTPITVMTISSWDDPVLDYPDLPKIADNEAAAINNAGGLNGHPVKVEACNDKFDPNAAEACARQAVSDHVQALVGGFSAYGDRIFPVIAAAGIPWLGNLAVTAVDLSSPYSFPGSPGPLLNMAPAVLAGQQCTRVSYLGGNTLDATSKSYLEDGIRSTGKEFVSLNLVANTTTDYSASVAQIQAANPDCLLLGLNEAALLQFIPALSSSGEGAKVKVFSFVGGQLTPRVVASFPKETEGWQAAGYYDVSSSALWQPYKKLMTDAGNLGKYLPNIFGAAQQRTYIAMLDFKEIVGTMTGPVTAAAIFAQFNKSCKVTSGGLAPVMNFCQPNSVPELQRVFNTSFTFQVIKNGQFELSKPGFQDLLPNYLQGSKAK